MGTPEDAPTGDSAADAAGPQVVGAQMQSMDAEGRSLRASAEGRGRVVLANVSGWTVTIKNQGHSVPAVEVAESGVVVALEGRWPVPVEIIGTGVTIDLTAQQSWPISIRTTGGSAQVVVKAGNVTVDGDDYLLRVESTKRDEVAISGEARVKKISGSGIVTLSSGFVKGTQRRLRTVIDRFAGTMRLTTSLEYVKLEGPDIDVEAHDIIGSTVIAAALTAKTVSGSDVSVSQMVQASMVDRSYLLVTAAEPGSPAIIVGRLRSRPRLSRLLTETPDWNRVFDQRGQASESRLESPSGDIYVGTLRRSTVSTGGSFYCAQDAAPALAPRGGEAGRSDDRRLIAVSGDCAIGGRLNLGGRDLVEIGSDLRIGKDLEGGLLQAQRLYVEGSIQNSTIETTDCEIVGNAMNSRLQGTRVQLSGAITNSRVDAQGPFKLEERATADAASQFVLRGSTTLPSGFAGRVEWQADSDDDTLVIQCVPVSLRLVRSKHTPRIELEGGAFDETWPVVKVDGLAEIRALARRQSESVWRLARLELAPEAKLQMHLELPAEVGAVQHGQGSVVERTVGKGLLTVCVDGCEDLTLTTVSEQTTKAKVTQGASASLIACGGGTLHIEGTLTRVHGAAANEVGAPWLSVPRGSAITQLSGDVRLQSVAGRIETRGSPSDSRPARIHDIFPQEDADAGLVHGIDPTPIPYASLEQAGAFHVFEPAPAALITWAKNLDGHRDNNWGKSLAFLGCGARRTPSEAREQAAKAQRIAEQVRQTAASGSTRSAAEWAAARTHHAAVKRGSLESALRWCHRALGYSQRPIPPVLTYLSSVLFCAFIVGCCDLLANDQGNGWAQLWPRALKMAALPISWFLRVPDDEQHALVFVHQEVRLAAFVLVAIPFVFFIISLRNFLAPPGGSKS